MHNKIQPLYETVISEKSMVSKKIIYYLINIKGISVKFRTCITTVILTFKITFFFSFFATYKLVIVTLVESH